MKVLVTGAGGLIGFEAARFFLEKKAEVIGIDNNMRKYFFGEKGDINRNIQCLEELSKSFKNIPADIRNREEIMKLFQAKGPFDLIVHAAAQPSHDWAAREPLTDFDVNAAGTLNLLEAFRLYSPKGVFIFTSTNKVYGDAPNSAKLVELEKRYEFAPGQERIGITREGVNENMRIDNSTHSVFGASKVAADIMAQEYGKYFKLNVGVFRGGCFTGPQHTAVELHGFLTYIVDCAVSGKSYIIFGYKGKQVRDHIHSRDVARLFYEFYKKPKQGVAYNIGGGKKNSASILEVIDILDEEFGYKLKYTYSEINRIGDHICYYTDFSKARKDYPAWGVKTTLREIIKEIIDAKKSKHAS